LAWAKIGNTNNACILRRNVLDEKFRVDISNKEKYV
jgi:hypothetical protein